MICPNCGNENPADYVFCDECGARLQNVGGADAEAVGAAAGTPTGIGSTGGGSQPSGGLGGSSSAGEVSAIGSAGGSTGSGGLSSAGGFDSGSMMDSGTIGGDDMSSGSGLGVIGGPGSAPSNLDATTLSPEYAMPAGGASEGEPVEHVDAGDSQTTSQAQISSADAGTDAGADADVHQDASSIPTYDDYNAWQPTGEQPPTAEATSHGGTEGEEIAAAPVTEDTVESAPAGAAHEGDEGAGAAVAQGDDIDMGEGDTSMPGVVPILGSYSDTEDTGATTSPATAAGAATGGTTPAGGGEWASTALNYLDRAQQSASQGNWGGFGEAMNNLRAYLQTASQGVQSSSPAMGAGTVAQAQAPAQGSLGSTPATITSGSGMGVAPESGTGSSGMPSMDMGAGMQSGPMAGGGDMGSGGIGMSAGSGPAGDVGVPTLEPAAEAGSLGADMAAQTQAPEGLAETTMARLVMIATGAELPLPDQEEILVGREDPSSGIFPDIDLTPYGGEDGGVSRRHSRLLHIGDDYFVEDLQSTNYTKLDGQRLPAHVRERLEDGARLDFGRVATIFRRS